MDRTAYSKALAIVLLLVGLSMSTATAQDKVAVNTSVDLYNRYVWRGLDIAATPSIQPSLSIGASGFELGTWGAYTLSNQTSESDEIDFWLSYTHDLRNGVSISAMVTDYYYPNAGIKFFSLEDYDEIREIVVTPGVGGDPATTDTLYGGAHTFELGLSFTGPESFPVTLAGYMNVYNDAGDNVYFQVGYPLTINGTELDLFCGAAVGSEDNPDYYGTDNLQVINLGLTAWRDIKVSDSFTLPLSVSFILNPNDEISHLLVGISL